MSTLNVNKIADASGGVLAPISSVMRNRIINGAMVIDQRNAGASVTPANGNYTLDRWRGYLTQASKYTVQQNAGAVTPPAGFTNYLGATSSSAYSVAAGDYFLLAQPIEGFNVADLGWGTANAKTVTLSFWVRSSLTGTFGGAFGNSDGNRSYPFSYTISSANTWTQISVTVAGDTTGTWFANNGSGIVIYWNLGTGTTYSGTAGTWAGTFYGSATGATSVVGTNGATFYITGVQLERGTQATGFEYRQYGTELALCHRYYFDTASTTNGGAGSGLLGAFMFKSFNANEAAGRNSFPAPMRTTPTITCFDNSGATGKLHRFASGDVGTNINFNNVTNTGITAISEAGTFTTTEPNMYGGRIIANAEL